MREKLFTPEGHVLRPTTPDATGYSEFEAIRPPSPTRSQTTAAKPSTGVRPVGVVQALEGMEGASDILEFLGCLLIPDPEQRPSATEAMAHHFLRFAHSKSVAMDNQCEVTLMHESASSATTVISGKCETGAAMGGIFQEMTERIKKDVKDDDEGCFSPEDSNAPSIAPSPSPEDEAMERSLHLNKRLSVSQSESKRESSVKIGSAARLLDSRKKSVGFQAQLNEVKYLHSEKAQQTSSGEKRQSLLTDLEQMSSGKLIPSAPAAPITEAASAHVKIQDQHGDNENKLSRKGTGFVHIGELPDTDDEDDDDDEEDEEETKGGKKAGAHVQIVEDKTDEKKHDGFQNKLARKGTGFVSLGELPPSDSEESEDEERPKPARVQIQDEKDAKAHDAEVCNKLGRKGTGFVSVGELPPSDDEEDSEEEEEAPRKGHVQISEDTGANTKGHDGENKLARKGTGFVSLGELPDSEDEDDEDEEESSPKRPQVKIQDEQGAKAHDAEVCNKLGRKGTGFVSVGELPPSDDEDDTDEEDSGNARKPAHVQIQSEDHDDGDKHVENKLSRKGTGFVHLGELPDTDDEDDDEDEDDGGGRKPAHVRIQSDDHDDGDKHVENKLSRKGTGFVHLGELPLTDDEDEDEEEEQEEASPPAKKGVGFGDSSHEGGSAKTISRQQTAFSKDTTTCTLRTRRQDDDDDDHHVQIKDSHGDNENKLSRKGTGFVHAGEMPLSDDEDDDEEEEANHVQFGGDVKSGDSAGKSGGVICRKGTGFVLAGDLPSDDEEDEDEERHVQINAGDKKEGKGNAAPVCRKGTGFVAATDIPSDSEEEEEKHVQASCDDKADKETTAKAMRKGTGFVSANDLPSDGEEDEEEEERHCRFAESDDNQGGKKAKEGGKPMRKGTGFVQMNEIPDFDEEEDDDE